MCDFFFQNETKNHLGRSWHRFCSLAYAKSNRSLTKKKSVHLLSFVQIFKREFVLVVDTNLEHCGYFDIL